VRVPLGELQPGEERRPEDRRRDLAGAAADVARLPVALDDRARDEAVRNLIGIGIPWTEAVRAATTTPARLIGREDLATLRPRTAADVIVLDDDFAVTRTLVDGHEMWAC
jgi:adenine deaminase